MNYILFIIKSALRNFSRNKGRTLLTSLGILIGVFSVVVLIAAGLGLKRSIQDQFDSIGTNTLRVVPGVVVQDGQFRGGGGAIGSIRFDERDVSRVERVPNIEALAPVFSRSGNIIFGSNKEFTDMYATTEGIFPGLNLIAQYGTLFTKADVNRRAKVAVIGPKLAENLFGQAQNAIGNSIKMDTQSYRVIGVLESKGGGGFGGPDLDSFIYVPYKSALVFNPDKKFVVMIVKVIEGEDVSLVNQRVTDELLKRYKEDDFSVFEPTEILNAVNSIFNTVNIVLVAIAAISLLVGGIGIMNIMYVTVTEKIKEIGIRRALGARKIDILSQFLIEAVILSLFGGLAGLVLAYAVVWGVQQFFPAYIDLTSVAIALGISTLIGVVFGVFPAKKAADLTPIDAIRYE